MVVFGGEVHVLIDVSRKLLKLFELLSTARGTFFYYVVTEEGRGAGGLVFIRVRERLSFNHKDFLHIRAQGREMK